MTSAEDIIIDELVASGSPSQPLRITKEQLRKAADDRGRLSIIAKLISEDNSQATASDSEAARPEPVPIVHAVHNLLASSLSTYFCLLDSIYKSQPEKLMEHSPLGTLAVLLPDQVDVRLYLSSFHNPHEGD